MCFENDHTDAEIARREHDYEMGGDTAAEIAFGRWCEEAKKLLGLKTLDGDQLEDGYSLDFAHEAFEDGHTPARYAERVRGNWDAMADPL